jgi:hypothetical protein
MSPASLLLMLCPILAAVTPLTPEQQKQVESATDFDAGRDEAALYPLMTNALTWQDADAAGATIPDYPAILAQPADHRGNLFLIEGLFAGRPRRIENLTRSGPWDQKLQEWVIVTDQPRDQVAVVYLVDPPTPIDRPPAPGTPVRLLARFYKVLSDRDMHGNPTDFLLFVGKSVTVTTPPRTRSSAWHTAPIFVAVLALGIIWLWLRTRSKPRPIGPQRFTRTEDRARGPTPRHPAEEEPIEDLPTDPAEALEALKQRRSTQG